MPSLHLKTTLKINSLMKNSIIWQIISLSSDGISILPATNFLLDDDTIIGNKQFYSARPYIFASIIFAH